MKIGKRKVGDVTILDLNGKILFGYGIAELREAIDDVVKENETQLLLNFDKVPYLDSAGLGEIVRSYTTIKKAGGMAKILNLTTRVRDLLFVTKLITVFDTYEDENEAVNSFK